MYLLDTHTLIWYSEDSPNIKSSTKKIISDNEYDVFLSLFSFWEISIKENLGKIKLSKPIEILYKEAIEAGFYILDFKFNHISELKKLEPHHKDPFDRILIAQAIAKNFTIITKDEFIKSYDVKTI